LDAQIRLQQSKDSSNRSFSISNSQANSSNTRNKKSNEQNSGGSDKYSAQKFGSNFNPYYKNSNKNSKAGSRYTNINDPLIEETNSQNSQNSQSPSESKK